CRPALKAETQSVPSGLETTFGWIAAANGSTGAAAPNTSPPAAPAEPPSTHGIATSKAARQTARIGPRQASGCRRSAALRPAPARESDAVHHRLGSAEHRE